LSYQKQGFKFGAGTPSHPDGDAHCNEMGIYQGHAYSILQIIEIDGK